MLASARAATHPAVDPSSTTGPHATTILAVRRGTASAIAGDGQVTLGNTVLKHGARKVRRLHHGRVLAGFAGATADAFTLFERFEARLEEHRGQLRRAAVELAREWRSDRALRRLEAMLLAADETCILVVSGTGDVVEPDPANPEGDTAIAIGSGGPFALAAARALLLHTQLSATEIARASMGIAADICIYTNHEVTLETVGNETVAPS